MGQGLGSIARGTIGGAYLLWAGVSVPTDHEAVPSGGVRWVSAETKQPELGAYERKVEGIRGG
jgi:hypothetical protein